ncbi:MAG TPA: Hsp20/alpha crystallin family protein [Mycobacteriales bacterium]|nr:Hsp20/alpha crystallin family protein [Mycobacteriales bacterium]
MLLERMDPFLAEFDRLTQRTLGAANGAGLPMDVIRREDELVVTVDLPGVPADMIGVSLDNQVLTIRAERHATYGEGDQVHLQERFDGAVSRRLRVPDWVDVDRVSATHVDGVLTVHLPLADRAKPRQIQVTGAQPITEISA